MAPLYTLEVHTPYRLFFSDQVQAISLTLSDGEAAIYANHVPLTAPVIPCLLKIRDKDGEWKTAYTSEGILEVGKNKTILVSDDAEWPEEIDCERAKAAKEQAEQTIAEEGMFKFETKVAADALRRANMRIRAWEEGKRG